MKPTLSQAEIESGLRNLGLGQGDVVLLHSSLASLGYVEGGADAVVDAFLNVIGAAGTLVVPIFGALGVVTEVVRNRPEAVRSVHPKACVAAIGRMAEIICREHWKPDLAHGPETPYTRIAEMGGYVCLLGVDQDRSTTLHTTEEQLRMPYLQPTAEVAFMTPEGEVTRSWPFFPGPHRDFIGLDRVFRESGKMRIGRIGNSVVRLMKSADLIRIAEQAGREDPAFVLCDNPNCAACVRQRADLRRDRFGRESFTLAASASLAGRYAEEIADNCLAAGIAAVELDCIRGAPLNQVKTGTLEKAVTALRENGCEPVALRLSCVPEALDKALALATENGIRRLVLPLSLNAAAQIGAARGKDVALSFFNAYLDSATASRLLLELRGDGLEAGFTFSPNGFARAGENPFLGSYAKRLRRFIDQLDLEDMTFDGTPQPLGRGNAEIKELISILRCASFAGFFVIAAANRFVGSLQDAVKRLETLLDTM